MSLRKQAAKKSPGHKPGENNPNDEVSPEGATEISASLSGRLIV